MAEQFNKLGKGVKKTFGTEGLGIDFIRDIQEAGDIDKDLLRKQKAKFEAQKTQEAAESFKPVAAPAQGPAKRIAGGKRRAESLLTRAV